MLLLFLFPVVYHLHLGAKTVLTRIENFQIQCQNFAMSLDYACLNDSIHAKIAFKHSFGNKNKLKNLPLGKRFFCLQVCSLF